MNDESKVKESSGKEDALGSDLIPPLPKRMPPPPREGTEGDPYASLFTPRGNEGDRSRVILPQIIRILTPEHLQKLAGASISFNTSQTLFLEVRGHEGSDTEYIRHLQDYSFAQGAYIKALTSLLKDLGVIQDA